VGGGDTERFRAFARTAGVEDRVRFIGVQSNTERFYAAGDLLLLPTLYETFSLVAYEAAATGLPIVATRVSGIDELLGADASGLAVERDSEMIGHALATLADDPELRSRLGAEGRLRASAYDWNRSVETVLDVYRSLTKTANGSHG
jgi:glycosyltransferase involved in cell wall biosynthesis